MLLYTFYADGPTLSTKMRLFLLTSTDTEFNIMLNLSFVVSNGVLSKIKCVDVDNTNLFPAYQTRRNQVPQLLREVIRSQYINISHPDMARVIVKVTLAMREPQIFTCTVYVEGRVNITSDSYFYKQMGNASIIANITGECVHDCCMHSICIYFLSCWQTNQHQCQQDWFIQH